MSLRKDFRIAKRHSTVHSFVLESSTFLSERGIEDHGEKAK